MKVRQEPDRLPEARVLLITAATVAATALGVFVAWQVASERVATLGGLALDEMHDPPWPQGLAPVDTERFDERPPGEASMGALPPPASPGERWQWIDRDRGIVRPPLDVAMDLYLERRKERAP